MKKAALLCLAALSTCGGCATLVTGGGHTQDLRVATVPIGASVYVDNNLVGLTPISAKLTRRDDHKVIIELVGYDPKLVDVKTGFNWWGFGDCCFGLVGIPMAIVDVSSGAGEGVLSPTNIDVKMTPTVAKVDGPPAANSIDDHVYEYVKPPVTPKP